MIECDEGSYLCWRGFAGNFVQYMGYAFHHNFHDAPLCKALSATEYLVEPLGVRSSTHCQSSLFVVTVHEKV